MSAVQELAQRLALSSEDALLETALTHPSYAHEQPGAADNQRLEFLGDAVLGCCVAEELYSRFTGASEGELTRLRARLVNASALAAWARIQGVPEALRLGRGALSSQLRDSTNVLADAVEALIAASYLRGGMEAARRVCRSIVEQGLSEPGDPALGDPKSVLQERFQASLHAKPTYSVVAEGGPPHERWFDVEVRLGEQVLARARGRSKRLAERAAAEQALDSARVGELLCLAAPAAIPSKVLP